MNKEIAKIAPNSIEAEEAVLGCILIDSKAMSKAMQILKVDDFYKASSKTIYEHF